MRTQNHCEYNHPLPVILMVLMVGASIGCRSAESNSTDNGKSESWTSKHHDVSLQWSNPWSAPQKFSDKKDELLALLLDNQDGSSVVIKVAPDVSSDVLDDQTYFNAIRQQMLNAHPTNTMIDEKDVEFHNATYKRMRFNMQNDKWKTRMCIAAFARRTGTKTIIVQWAFPIKDNTKTDYQLPAKIKQVNEDLKLFESSAK